jgi:pyridoxal phosphate-dependent aminotransferase EpsN
MQLQPVFAQCRYFSHEGKSVSQRLFETGICLPSGSNMSVAQQERVIHTIINLMRNG